LAKIPSWPPLTNSETLFFTVSICIRLFPGHGEMLSAMLAAFTGSALSADVTSTQSRAESW